MIIPLKFRQQLGEVFLIVKGIQDCLLVWTEDEWAKRFEQNQDDPRFIDEQLWIVERYFRDNLQEASVDNQGRVAISQKLREYAGIEVLSDVIIIGMPNRLEIWNKERWEQYNSNLTREMVVRAAADVGIGRI